MIRSVRWRAIGLLIAFSVFLLTLSGVVQAGSSGPAVPKGHIVLKSADGKSFTMDRHGVNVTFTFLREELDGEDHPFYLRYYDAVATLNGEALLTWTHEVSKSIGSGVWTLESARAAAVKDFKEWYGVDITTELMVEVAPIGRALKALKEPAAGSKPNPALTFDDLASAGWAEGSIAWARKLGLIKGRSEKQFDPGAPITQTEALILMVRLLDLEAEAKAVTDPGQVPTGLPGWAAGYYRVAADQGLITSADPFSPMDPADRGLVATLLVRALKLTSSDHLPHPFADAGEMSAEEKAAVDLAAGNGLIKGYEDSTFRPRKAVSRAEMAVLLYRAANKSERWKPQVAGSAMAGESGLLVDGKTVTFAADALVVINGKRSSIHVIQSHAYVTALLNDRGEAEVVVVQSPISKHPVGLQGFAGLQAAANATATRLTVAAGQPVDLSAYGLGEVRLELKPMESLPDWWASNTAIKSGVMLVVSGTQADGLATADTEFYDSSGSPIRMNRSMSTSDGELRVEQALGENQKVAFAAVSLTTESDDLVQIRVENR